MKGHCTQLKGIFLITKKDIENNEKGIASN